MVNKTAKGALPQTSTRAYKKICEEYSLENVILEVAQNAFEHGDAPLCNARYNCDEKGVPSITFFNNGKPMFDKQFQKFVSEYHCHDISESTPSPNGVFTSLKGYGLKDLVVFCSSDTGISRVRFRNYHKDGRLTEWNWYICKTNGDKGSYDFEITSTTYDVCSHPSGFEIMIENCKEFTETELSKAQKKIAKTFTQDVIAEGRTIQLTWKGKNTSTIKLYDPMHFEKMSLNEGDTIYNCPVGEYISDDIIWFVDEHMFRGIEPVNNELVEVPVRIISAYINEPTYKKKYPFKLYYDNIGTKEAGFFPLLGRSYLETGGNKCSHLGGSDNAGGAPRYRVCPIITNENAFLWGISSIKNSGIKPFDGNPLLVERFKMIKEDNSDGNTLYEYLRERYSFLVGFHASKIRVKKSEFDYYSNNGFVDRERTQKDIDDYKYSASPSNEDEIQTHALDFTYVDRRDSLYEITKKSAIIKKVKNEENEWVYSLNGSVINSNYNEATKEDILFSLFDLLHKMGIDSTMYQEIAEALPTEIHPYGR